MIVQGRENTRFDTLTNWDSVNPILERGELAVAVDGSTMVLKCGDGTHSWSELPSIGGTSALSAYPVGSVYMSFNATSPATLFGGTWEQLADGRVLIGANSSYAVDSTGGEVSHTLIVEETPSHTHTRGSMNITGETRWISGNALWQGDPNGAFEKYYTDNVSTIQVATSGTGARYAFKFDASRNWTGETSSVGGSQAHNNMQPYRAVYMWRRTA